MEYLIAGLVVKQYYTKKVTFLSIWTTPSHSFSWPPSRILEDGKAVTP